MRRAALLWSVFLALALACGEEPDERPGGSTRVESSAPAPRPKPVLATPAVEPNPLGLPFKRLEVPEGTPIYAPPLAMLRGARLGTAMQLRATTVAGKDGDLLLVDGGEDPDFLLHPGYVVVHTPGSRTPRLNQPVLTSFGGLLRHGVVKSFIRSKVVVRFTDVLSQPERQLDAAVLMAQADGLAPGNYAALKIQDGYEHVLLVSRIEGAPSAPNGPVPSKTAAPKSENDRWLVIGYGGATAIVAAAELALIPVTYEPKVGAAVWAEHLGRMRRGVVAEVDKPSVFAVRFERAGSPVNVGWGGLMPPMVVQPR